MNTTAIIGTLARMTILPDEEKQYFLTQLSWKNVIKGQFLLRAGDNFEHEGKLFTDYRSLHTSMPASLSIQALEDSHIALFTESYNRETISSSCLLGTVR